MDLLNRHGRWGLALLLTALISGCVLYDALPGGDAGPRDFVFSHEIHVWEEELACIDCHTPKEGAPEGAAPGFPLVGQCGLCHEDIDAEAPPERQVDLLFDGEDYVQTWPEALDAELVFPHAAHAEALGSCDACHTGIETNQDVALLPQYDMQACMDCHAREAAPNECATCHTEVGTDWAPDSHAHNWELLHGPTMRSGSRAQADRCTTCHTESTCASCHAEQKPRSHNQFWSRRGHGLHAAFDRESCSTCHTPDTCARCHASTTPQNHTAMWGGTKSTHCISCHEPLADQGCGACHKATPSHLTATPMPAWHEPAMNCRLCHGVDAPLPHVDKGDLCISCHL